MIKMWYAVDKGGLAYISSRRPRRACGTWIRGGRYMRVEDKTGFPALTWDDEPIEVEIYTKPATNEIQEKPVEAIQPEPEPEREYWYAVDKDGDGFIYTEKPTRDSEMWVSVFDFFPAGGIKNLPTIFWHDEPVKIGLTVSCLPGQRFIRRPLPNLRFETRDPDSADWLHAHAAEIARFFAENCGRVGNLKIDVVYDPENSKPAGSE